MAKKSQASSGIYQGITQAPFYPLAYVKVLIQIGHEPLPPSPSNGIFGMGKGRLFYPNSLSYLRYIYSVEGVSGLYRGLGMKVIGQSVGTIVCNKVSEVLDENEPDNVDKSTVEYQVKQTSKDITARCIGVVISQPFHVMGLRCMAQFIGGETNYSSWNVFSNTVEIYKSEGISGFFSGLIPRLLFEASTIAIANAIVYVAKKYIFDDKEFETVVDLFASLLSNALTYPLSLVSTISSISGSALVAAKPPRMPNYQSWVDVFKHLYEQNELKRGSSTFFRAVSPANLKYQGFAFTQ